nr:hypothetical protein [Streptomyces sp. AS02]
MTVPADEPGVLAEVVAVPDLQQGVGGRRAVVGDVDDGEGVLNLEALLVLPDVLADESAREGVRTLGDLGVEDADAVRGGGGGLRRGGGRRAAVLRRGVGRGVGRREAGDREPARRGDGTAADQDATAPDGGVPAVPARLLLLCSEWCSAFPVM